MRRRRKRADKKERGGRPWDGRASFGVEYTLYQVQNSSFLQIKNMLCSNIKRFFTFLQCSALFVVQKMGKSMSSLPSAG